MIVANFRTAADGIARETALLQGGKPALLLWQANENALVVPTALARRAGFDTAASLAAAQGWKVTTRGSGGGIVPQGPGTLNLAMIVPGSTGFTMDAGYRLICSAVAKALTQFEITSTTGSRAGAFCDGTWNVLAQGRKLAGTAQRWRSTPKGHVALIHTAILTRTPDPGLWRILRGLHKVALPAAPLPCANAHIAMDELVPSKMTTTRFPGALLKAVEDCLSIRARQKKEAA